MKRFYTYYGTECKDRLRCASIIGEVPSFLLGLLVEGNTPSTRLSVQLIEFTWHLTYLLVLVSAFTRGGLSRHHQLR